MYINNKLVKLGKGPVNLKKLAKTLKLAKYIKALPPVPSEVSWIIKMASAIAIPMYLNDSEGDCVAAAAGHMEQQWNYYAGHPWQPTDADIQASYEAVGGFVPGNPSTDNGMDMLSYLEYWQSTGLGGHKILTFLAVDWTNLNELRVAIQLFGNVYLGVQLPVSAQGQTAWTVAKGGIYTPSGQPGSWGGHCVPLVASSPFSHTCETWGTLLKMSHAFLADYADEAYVVLSPDWLEANSLSPSGFDLTQLQSDMAQL
jgi:hypothetical protein